MSGRGVQGWEGIAWQSRVMMCVAPEGLAAQPCIPSAAKWYLTAQLTGFSKVPAQQKGLWSTGPVRSSQEDRLGGSCVSEEGDFPQKC